MNSDSYCIILAGGLGTRLRNVVSDRPKCLASVGRKFFLQYQLELLESQGISKFIISLGFMAEIAMPQILKLGEKFNISTLTENYQLGTGGAILFAMHHFNLNEAMITNGDTYLDGSLEEMHKPLEHLDGEMVRLAATFVPDRTRFGGISVVGRNVKEFIAKGEGTPGLINAGFYRIRKSIFESRNVGDSFSLEIDMFPALIAKDNISVAILNGEFIDIGVPEDYYKFKTRYG